MISDRTTTGTSQSLISPISIDLILTGNGNSSIRLFLTLRYRKLVHSENLAGKEDSLLWERARLCYGERCVSESRFLDETDCQLD